MRKDYALTAEQRADARQALSLLDGRMTLTQAVERVLGREVTTVYSWDQAVDLYTRRLLTQKKSAATVRWYEERLGLADRVLGGQGLPQIDRATIRQTVMQSGSQASQAAVWRAIRAVLNYAARQEPPWFDASPLQGWSPVEPVARKAEPHYLPVPVVERMLANVPATYLPAVVVQLFAGVRPEEVAGREGKPRLEWRHLNRADGVIRVPAEVAKTRRARVIEGLPEALWAWLPKSADDGPLLTVAAKQVARMCRVAAGLDKWPQDALRHSFATYAVALWGDAGRVALILGHESGVGLLHRHYRGLATKAEAERFFALRPGRHGGG